MNISIKSVIVAISLVFALANAKIIYPRAYIVIDVNDAENVVTISDVNGFIYKFEGVEDYVMGDMVSCIMYSGTDNDIFDDEIIFHRCAGHIEFFNEIYNNLKTGE